MQEKVTWVDVILKTGSLLGTWMFRFFVFLWYSQISRKALTESTILLEHRTLWKRWSGLGRSFSHRIARWREKYSVYAVLSRVARWCIWKRLKHFTSHLNNNILKIIACRIIDAIWIDQCDMCRSQRARPWFGRVFEQHTKTPITANVIVKITVVTILRRTPITFG